MESQLALVGQAKSTLVDLAIKFGPKVVVAILILIAGIYAGRALGRMFDRSLGRMHLDPPVRIYLPSGCPSGGCAGAQNRPRCCR
jgi:small conductance mechanosensitive channel